MKLLAALRDKVSDRKYVVESLKAVTPDFIAICRDVTCDEVKKEMKKYASMESSMLRNSSAEHMETFSLQVKSVAQFVIIHFSWSGHHKSITPELWNGSH